VSQDPEQFKQSARLASLVGQVGCVAGLVSVAVIAASFFAGRYLDSLLEAGGILTVLFLVGSFPITLFIILRISLAVVSRAQPTVAPHRAEPEESTRTSEEASPDED
jgi:hypothetical protein